MWAIGREDSVPGQRNMVRMGATGGQLEIESEKQSFLESSGRTPQLSTQGPQALASATLLT